MAVSVALFADDLTGALDSVEPFARGALSTAVAVDIAAIPEAIARDCDVVAINTDSRSLAPIAARRRIRAAWEALAGSPPRLLMKKVDSRLKGNVAAETDELLFRSGRVQALVCPAIPEIGRYVVGGQVTGLGVSKPIEIQALFDELTPRFTLFDCSDVETLDMIAGAVLAEPEAALAVGARGLAHALASRLCQSGWVAPSPLTTIQLDGPMLVIVGSRDPITLEQLDRLLEHYPDAVLIRGGATDAAAIACVKNPRLTVVLPNERATADPATVAKALATTALAITSNDGPRITLISGGDTLRAFVRAAGIGCLTPVGQLGTGIPISTGNAHGEQFALVSKSGGFGTPDTFIEVVERVIGPPVARRPVNGTTR